MQIINPNLFLFFSKLKKNNNRDWFQSNKAEFKLLEGQIKLFMKHIEQNLNIHDKIEKAKIFRIYIVVFQSWHRMVEQAVHQANPSRRCSCPLPLGQRCNPQVQQCCGSDTGGGGHLLTNAHSGDFAHILLRSCMRRGTLMVC